MILTVAIILGLLAGLANAWRRKGRYQPPDLRHAGLVLLAFVAQFLIFRLPATRALFADSWIAPAIHILSQFLLLAFVWGNRRIPAFSILGLGLALNAAVILANGGFMPISPSTAQRLFQTGPQPVIETGHRLMTSKNIVLLPEDTRLEWLADRYVLENGFLYPAALSLGDFFIAAGAFWLLAVQRRSGENHARDFRRPFFSKASALANQKVTRTVSYDDH